MMALDTGDSLRDCVLLSCVIHTRAPFTRARGSRSRRASPRIRLLHVILLLYDISWQVTRVSAQRRYLELYVLYSDVTPAPLAAACNLAQAYSPFRRVPNACR